MFCFSINVWAICSTKLHYYLLVINIHHYSTDFKFYSLAERLSVLDVDDNALLILTHSLLSPPQHAMVMLLPSRDHLNKTLPCAPSTPSYPSPPKGHHYGTAPFN